MNKKDVTKIQDDILRNVLPQIAFDGWHWETIIRAAADIDHSEAVTHAVFPGGITDVLNTFSDLADREMLKNLSSQAPEDLRIRERIHTALMARYTFLIPHKEALRQSIQYSALPTRKIRAAKNIWRTADTMWGWAGDTAQDYNRYTKRGLLSGILVSSSLYYINDKTDTLDNLERFIERRISNVMQLGKIIGKRKKHHEHA